MKNIDYYAEKFTRRMVECNDPCPCVALQEFRKVREYPCPYSEDGCETCKAEVKEWLEQPFDRISEKDKKILEFIKGKKWVVSRNSLGVVCLRDSDKPSVICNLSTVFGEDIFMLLEPNSEKTVEELLEKEIA